MSGCRAAATRGAERLKAAGIESARADARILLAHAQGDEMLFEGFLARREQLEPVAYITGHKEFWSLDFEVGPGVLIPRPETETLIEEALKEFPTRSAPLRLLDLGAGSGCILIAALSEFPEACGVALERSADAIMWLQRNIDKHGLSNRCAVMHGDWRYESAGEFDAVFSNPPYVSNREMAKLPATIARYEPRPALMAGSDGLAAYRELAPRIAACLRPHGKAFLEVGAGQEEKVSGILRSAGLETVRIATDLAGIARCIVAARAGKTASGPQKTVGKGQSSR